MSDRGEELTSEWDFSTMIGGSFFPYERGPKVYRNTYAINPERWEYRRNAKYQYPFELGKKDVTSKYFLTSDLAIPVDKTIQKQLKDKYVYIAAAVRSEENPWQIVDLGKINLLVILLALTTGLICLSIVDSTFGLGWQVLDRCMMGMWGALCYIAIKFYHETCTHTIHVSASNPAILEAINTLCSKEKEIGEEKVGVTFGIYDTSKERIEMKVCPLSDHLNEPTDTKDANGTAN